MSTRQAILRELYLSGRRAWPSIAIEEQCFLSYWGERLQDCEAQAIASYAGDLYLACACAAGDERALSAFMREIWPEVEIALSRLDTGDLFAADVAADLAMDLFTGDPKGVVRYRGRGPLGAWLRVAAVRRLANARRSKRRKREQELTDDELLVRVTASTPELEVAKAVARQAVSTALSEALQLLSPAERNLLRSHHLDGQTFAQLAAIYHLDDSRVWRMLCRARAKLAAATREKLYTRLGMERSEVDSLLRMALSQLDTNLRRALGTEEIQAEPDA